MSTIRLKQVAANTALVLATLATLLVVYRLREVVLLFSLSVLLAAALRKNILWLEAHRIPRGFAILIWYLIILGVLLGGSLLLANSLQSELQSAANRLPAYYDELLAHWQSAGLPWQQSVAHRLPTTAKLLGDVSRSDPRAVGFGILGVTSSIVNIVVSLVIVFSLTYYWLADQERFERLWLTLLAVQQRAVARATWRDTERQIGAFVRSEAVQFVLTVASLALAFGAIGLPYGTMLALYAGFAQLIPWLGVPLTLVPLLFMLPLASLPTLLLAAGAVIVIGIIMDRVLEPYLSQGAGAHPVLVIAALLLMAHAVGVLGMIIALPLAATMQIVASAVFRANAGGRDMTLTQESAQLQEIKDRLLHLRADIPDDPENRPALEDMLARLDGLLSKTETMVKERSHVVDQARGRTSRQPLKIPSIFQRRG
ncbi:MAG: hypothetical protein NVS4B8_02120 [Herpetosiphon sp.]